MPNEPILPPPYYILFLVKSVNLFKLPPQAHAQFAYIGNPALPISWGNCLQGTPLSAQVKNSNGKSHHGIVKNMISPYIRLISSSQTHWMVRKARWGAMHFRTAGGEFWAQMPKMPPPPHYMLHSFIGIDITKANLVSICIGRISWIFNSISIMIHHNIGTIKLRVLTGVVID